MTNSMQPIIIKKKKAHGHGHHSSAWKVAFADFMTAMMAFFLLMWLLGSTTKEEKEAISGYFQDPLGTPMSAGGVNSGAIDLGTPLTQMEASVTPDLAPPAHSETKQPPPRDSKPTESELDEALARREQEALEELQRQLAKALEQADSALRELRDQIIIDQTPLGLRIQIVDKAQRPMFNLGNDRLQPHAEAVLASLAPLLDKVPNRISITGHTDSVSFGSGALYTNWELSADRANSARRTLLDSRYPEAKILTVQGMGDAAPFKPDAPDDAANRRIAIIVLKKSVEEALLGHRGTSSKKVIRSEGRILEPLGN